LNKLVGKEITEKRNKGEKRQREGEREEKDEIEMAGCVPRLKSLSIRDPLTVGDIKAIGTHTSTTEREREKERRKKENWLGTAAPNLIHLHINACKGLAAGAAEALTLPRFFGALAELKLKRAQLSDVTFTSHLRAAGVRMLTRLAMPARGPNSIGSKCFLSLSDSPPTRDFWP